MMSAAADADAAGNETEAEAAVREAKPTTPRSILRRDASGSSGAAEGATRKRVTFEEVRGYGMYIVRTSQRNI